MLRHLTKIEGTTVAELAKATGMPVTQIRAALVDLEATGKAYRQRAAVGQPHRWWQVERKPLSSLDILLAMALAARIHKAPGKIRAITRSLSTRVIDPVGKRVMQMVSTSSKPTEVIARAVEYYFDDEVPA